MSRKPRPGSTFLLDPSHATLPGAVWVAQRSPDPGPRYAWYTRLGDWWAGRRDRPQAAALPVAPDGTPTVADTAYLRRLGYECDTRIDTEQRTTATLCAVLHDQHTRLTTTCTQLQADLQLAETHQDTLQGRTPEQGARSASEQYATSYELRQLRAAEHAAACATATANTRRLRAALAETRTALAGTITAIASHHRLLTIRTIQLTDYHARRAGTYTRALSARRRSFTTPTPPAITNHNQAPIPTTEAATTAVAAAHTA